ncbi:MAG: gliding motility-associated C-terminal domain-containing protein [Fimbriimonadaceae bacterium]|nr:gliding motility-associated C-terminal domain-containing protein [Chitinophagales bacterium]
MRNVDPDQDLDHCGSFGTTNEIIYNPPTDDTALVSAIGDVCGCYLGIGAIDERARVSFGNFFISPATPEGGWMGDAGEGYSDEGSTWCDCAIQISFQLDIAAGECETIYFAHVLDPSDLQVALEATLTGGFVGVSADGTQIDTSGIVEKCELDTLTLEILNAEEYEWTWTPSFGLSADTGAIVFAFPDTTTTYIVHGLSECGELLDTITIIVHNVQGNANAGPDTLICPDDTLNLMGSGGVTYLWQPPVYLEDQTDPNTALNNPPTDMYYFLIAYDDIGCPDTDVVYIDRKPRPDIDAGPDKIMALGTFTQLFANGGETYLWVPGETLSDSTADNPIATPDDTITYLLTGTDEFGCVNWDSVTVFVIDPAFIQNPNIFTPNYDGVNDKYLPNVEGLGVLIDFQVYNRWGALVYDWSAGEQGWDGTVNGKMQEIGTYLVLIEAYDSIKQVEIRKTANVILMK